jgi:hypothetical protein
MKKLFLTTVLILFSGISYGQYYFADGNPPNLKITYTTTKGLLNSAETIFLSRDSCYYETIYQDISNRFAFYITSKNMDEMYDILLKYEIPKISSKQLGRAAPERAGDNLLLQWGEYSSIVTNNSGNFILEDKWLNNWKKIVKNIRKFVKVEIDNRSRNFTVRLDESFSDKKLAMYLNNEFLYDNTVSSVNVEGFTITLAAVPGQYYLKAVIDDTGASQEFKVDLTEGTELKLSLKGNNIELTN